MTTPQARRERAEAIVTAEFGLPLGLHAQRLVDRIAGFAAQEAEQASAQARAEERERCAQLADHGGPDAPWNGRDAEELKNMEFVAKRIAAAIRAPTGATMSEVKKALTVFICPGGCACRCALGGLCEHVFNAWENDPDGRGGSVVCARCGASAMAHDLRVLP